MLCELSVEEIYTPKNRHFEDFYSEMLFKRCPKVLVYGDEFQLLIRIRY